VEGKLSEGISAQATERIFELLLQNLLYVSAPSKDKEVLDKNIDYAMDIN
jgi:hypothetical protein